MSDETIQGEAPVEEAAEPVREFRILSREEIRHVEDLERERVHVRRWKGDVLVQGMSAEDKDWIEDSAPIVDGRRGTPSNMRAKVAIACCINEDGSKMFRREDEAWLAKHSAAALEDILPVALRLSGWTDEEREKIAGNSSGGQSDSSSTA